MYVIITPSHALFAVVVVGFSEAQFIAMESALVMEVRVELTEGELDIPVTVELVLQPRPEDLATGAYVRTYIHFCTEKGSSHGDCPDYVGGHYFYMQKYTVESP